MIWGIFPIDEKISWEAHLMGALAGLVLAIFYRKHGPQRIKYDWEEEEDEMDDESEGKPEQEKISGINYTDTSADIKYFYLDKNPEEKEDSETK